MIICQCSGLSEKDLVERIKKVETPKIPPCQLLNSDAPLCCSCVPAVRKLIKENKPAL